MITSTLLIFSLIAAPDLYFKRANGEVAVAAVRKGDQSLQLCVRTILSNDVGIPSRSITFGSPLNVVTVRPISSRLSVATDGIWTLDIAYSTLSGTRAIDGYAKIEFFKIDEIKKCECGPERLKDLVLDQTKTPPDRSKVVVEGILSEWFGSAIPKMPSRKMTSSHQSWNLPHYSGIVGRLAPNDIPYASIAAISPEKVIVSIYINRRMAFIELFSRKLTAEEWSEFKGMWFYDLESDGLEWKSLGTAETNLNTWSTGIWADDSLNLIGDDGYCERFKLVDGKMVRIGKVTGLPAPTAICHVGPDIWLLSEEEDATEATKVSWDESASHREIDLGPTSIDQAAQIVFDPEELAWRLNYSLFISVLPFLIAGVVVLFVAWRVMKARRLSQSR